MVYLVLAVAFSAVAVVALPLLLPQSKLPPEPDKSPGPPKIAIKMFLGRVMSLVRPRRRFLGGLGRKHQINTLLNTYSIAYAEPIIEHVKSC